MLESDLADALERGELMLAYQPIVNLQSEQPTGCEALARWNHRHFGPISPAEFIPIAERIGAICHLGDWVLGAALLQLANWTERAIVGPGFSMAVNVSATQLADATFVDRVKAALDYCGISPERLQIEVTESVLMENHTGSIDHVRDLRRLGVRIALDDFGTGYSSLAYLKTLPVQTLKIDRAFINGLGEDAADEAIVSAIVTLGDALGLTIVAEGVEHPAQRDLLVRLGCPQAQGYLWGRPSSPHDIARWIDSNRSEPVAWTTATDSLASSANGVRDLPRVAAGRTGN